MMGMDNAAFPQDLALVIRHLHFGAIEPSVKAPQPRSRPKKHSSGPASRVRKKVELYSSFTFFLGASWTLTLSTKRGSCVHLL